MRYRSARRPSSVVRRLSPRPSLHSLTSFLHFVCRAKKLCHSSRMHSCGAALRGLASRAEPVDFPFAFAFAFPSPNGIGRIFPYRLLLWSLCKTEKKRNKQKLNSLGIIVLILVKICTIFFLTFFSGMCGRCAASSCTFFCCQVLFPFLILCQCCRPLFWAPLHAPFHLANQLSARFRLKVCRTRRRCGACCMSDFMSSVSFS